MTATLLNGKKIAKKIEEEVKTELSRLKSKPTLSFILVGDDNPSKIYVEAKERACHRVGIESKDVFLSKETSESELLDVINKLNKDSSINGILIQLPLPKGISEESVFSAINPNKDVEGFHPMNAGKLFMFGDESLAPCTPKGIINLLEHYSIPIKGKNVVIINNSAVVGKPLCIMLTKRFATVDLCHIKTSNLRKHTLTADIIISATGKAKLITSDMVKKGAIIVDAGISKINNIINGDVDTEAVKEIASFISPVPGGVGPMTIAMLLKNMVILEKLRKNKI